MIPSLDSLLAGPLFALSQEEKEKLLLPLLFQLTEHHKMACPPYRQIVNLAFPLHKTAQRLEQLPYLPLSLFKHRRLRSVPDADIRVTVKSSGTTGTARSKVDLDVETARLSSQALAATLRAVIGGERRPMLIVDTHAALRGTGGIGARASAILGLMPFGRHHAFILREDLSVDEEVLRQFLAQHGNQPFLIYGFTYLVWQKLLPACEQGKLDLSWGVLLHSGGWKGLSQSYTDNATFKKRFQEAAGIRRTVNFYGMAEMPGTIFPENEDGLLYPPAFASVVIRDPVSFQPLEAGYPGLVQILNLIPRSYPGHSLLTEDLGLVEAVDSGVNGWKGQAVRILGRAPKTALRGCSNVLAAEAG